MTTKTLYTIGYAHHTIESFINLLQCHGINSVIDVRTMAYSGFHPQFNKEIVKAYLKEQGIVYLHMPEAFGIIKTERALNTKEGYVDFVKLARLPLFLEGLLRVDKGTQKGYTIAFMCAEKDPIDCHRTTLVARALVARGYAVKHIHHDGHLESHSHLEERMKASYVPKENQLHLFEEALSEKERLEEAYRRCSKEIFITNAKRVLKEDYDYPHPNEEG